MGTFNNNMLPTSTGLDLGSDNQRWDGFFNNADLTGNLNVDGTATFAGIGSVVGVEFPTALTSAGIQAAIDAVAAGGTVYLPVGTYVFSNTITITKSITLVGAGWGTVIQVPASINGTTDIFLIQPPLDTVLHGGQVGNFAIIPASGTPARYAFHLDGTNGEILNWEFNHIRVEQLGSNAVYAEGPGYDTFHSPQGTPALTLFTGQSVWRGGFNFTSAGDTNHIEKSQITGTGTNDFNFLAGAGNMLFGPANNVTIDGGTHFGTNVYNCQIFNNEFETFATFTGSHGAVLDIDGDSGASSLANFCNIIGNGFNVTNGITADELRINYAANNTVLGNRFNRGATTSHDIILTSNSVANFILTNMWASGVPFTSMVNDAGTRNLLSTAWTTGQLLLGNSQALASIDDTGAAQPLLQMNSNGSITLSGYRGNTALTSTNFITSIYDGTSSNRIAASASTSNSTAPVVSTVFSAYKFYAGAGGLQIGATGTNFSGATGTVTQYNNVATAGQGISAILGTTSQKAEIAADTNLLTYTPVAQAGTYRINFMLSLSAANTATLGWTATWKDSNGNAQSPTNLSLIQEGTAAPALTFTTSTAGNYHATAVIDIDNSATAIVVKLTFSGTSFAGKATATVERLN